MSRHYTDDGVILGRVAIIIIIIIIIIVIIIIIIIIIIIHQKPAEAAELIENKSPYYKYTPVNVLENDNFKPYWNRSIIMDKTIPLTDPT